MKRLIAMTVLVLLVSRSAYAYLDPGTGSMLVQGVLAAIALASATIAAFWSRIVRFLGRQRRDECTKQSVDRDSQGS